MGFKIVGVGFFVVGMVVFSAFVGGQLELEMIYGSHALLPVGKHGV